MAVDTTVEVDETGVVRTGQVLKLGNMPVDAIRAGAAADAKNRTVYFNVRPAPRPPPLRADLRAVATTQGKFVPEHEARVSIFDSSLMFGDMAFEMTRTYNGEAFCLR